MDRYKIENNILENADNNRYKPEKIIKYLLKNTAGNWDERSVLIFVKKKKKSPMNNKRLTASNYFRFHSSLISIRNKIAKL